MVSRAVSRRFDGAGDVLGAAGTPGALPPLAASRDPPMAAMGALDSGGDDLGDPQLEHLDAKR